MRRWLLIPPIVLLLSLAGQIVPSNTSAAQGSGVIDLNVEFLWNRKPSHSCILVVPNTFSGSFDIIIDGSIVTGTFSAEGTGRGVASVCGKGGAITGQVSASGTSSYSGTISGEFNRQTRTLTASVVMTKKVNIQKLGAPVDLSKGDLTTSTEMGVTSELAEITGTVSPDLSAKGTLLWNPELYDSISGNYEDFPRVISVPYDKGDNKVEWAVKGTTSSSNPNVSGQPRNDLIGRTLVTSVERIGETLSSDSVAPHPDHREFVELSSPCQGQRVDLY